eukprot:scaffold44773_cov45-Attheya_sp.AAC.3
MMFRNIKHGNQQTVMMMLLIFEAIFGIASSFQTDGRLSWRSRSLLGEMQQKNVAPLHKLVKDKPRGNEKILQMKANDDERSKMIQYTKSRRSFFFNTSIKSAFFIPPLFVLAKGRSCDAAQTVGEAVRKSASNIPGYGSPDVYFPSSFSGKWMAQRTILSSDDSLLAPLLPITLTYEIRFISVDDVGNKVIADRGFNEASYQAAVNSILGEKTSLVVQSFDWSSSNPNVLTVSYADGSSKETKVTKRAASIEEEEESGMQMVSCSEFRRESVVGERGIPSLSATRLLAKWKTTPGNPDLKEGIEI